MINKVGVYDVAIRVWDKEFMKNEGAFGWT